MSLKRNIILNLFRTLMSLVFPLITFPYASRILLPEGLGKINFAQSIVSYFSMIAALGIGTYASREIAKRKVNTEQLNKFFSEIFLFNIISTVIAYVLLIGAVICIKKLSDYRLIILVFSMLIMFTTIGVEWLYVGLEDFFYITIRSFIFQCISVVCLFIFVKTKEDILEYAFISVISNVGSNICNFIHSRRYVKFVHVSRTFYKEHITPIIIIFLTAVANSVYTMLDTTMLGFIAGDTQVGYYTAATKINRIVLSVILSIGPVMLPRLSYLRNNNQEEEYKNLLNKSLCLMLAIACPCVTGLEVLSKEILLVLSGEKFLPALITMRIMNPIILIVCFGNFFGVQVFLPNNKEKLNLRFIIIAAIINFILNAFLIPKYSANGAAIASLIAELFVSISCFLFGYKYINYKKIICSLIKYFLNSLIMGIIVFLLSKKIDCIIIKLIVSVFIGVIVYFCIMLLEKDVLLYEQIRKIQYRGKK